MYSALQLNSSLIMIITTATLPKFNQIVHWLDIPEASDTYLLVTTLRKPKIRSSSMAGLGPWVINECRPCLVLPTRSVHLVGSRLCCDLVLLGTSPMEDLTALYVI